mmetsp:Transcript_21495/g.52670  ORF Transcript_21495/g.52670 Transcript_21495/m.52670 type:complete len:97 (-) Transcript_21495:916-1206(-)
MGNSFVRVNRPARLFAVEEIFDELLNLRDTCGSSNKDDIVNLALRHLGILQHLLDRGECVLEVVHAKIIKTRPGELGGEVNPIVERINLHSRNGRR